MAKKTTLVFAMLGDRESKREFGATTNKKKKECKKEQSLDIRNVDQILIPQTWPFLLTFEVKNLCFRFVLAVFR